MNDDTTANETHRAERWLIPVLPASDAVMKVSHAFKIGLGPVRDDYCEPVCGISAFIDQLCVTSEVNRCPDCVAELDRRQQP